MQIFPTIAAVALFAAGQVSGQVSGQPAGLEASAKSSALPESMDENPDQWSFSASVSGYVIPDDRDYLSPVFMADRDWLHLEARYNYESLETGSLWLGYNFSFGERWVLELTPMVGGVFGDTRGIAPGWRLSLSRGSFEFTTEAEYLFDLDDSSDNFFYAWSELTWSFTDSFWVGLALQRTRAYATDLDIQRGFLVGVSIRDVDFTAYVFNWGWTEPTLVFSVGFDF